MRHSVTISRFSLILVTGALALPADALAAGASPSNPDPQRIALDRSLGGYLVKGAGNPALDPRNVQWALDRSDGGSVFLRGTFDLGTSTVYITKNVTLAAAPGAAPVIKNGGDPDAGHDSPHQAAIYVGWNGEALLSPPAAGLYGSQEHPRFPGVVEYFPALPVKFAIRGLRFQDCVRGAIIVGASTGATIENCSFSNIRWGAWDAWYEPQLGYRSFAILFTGGLAWPYLGLTSTSVLDIPSLTRACRSISGPVRIRNNTIDNVGRSALPAGADPAQAEGFGVLFAVSAADAVVEKNRIRGIGAGNGIYFLGNMGSRSVAENNVVSDTDSDAIIGWTLYFTCTFTFTGNTVTVGGPDFASGGISIEADMFDPQQDFVYVASDGTSIGSVISRNRIIMNGSQGGAISLYDHCVQTQVTDNVIQGSAAWGIGSIILTDPETAEQNTIAGNTFAPSFQSDLADILLMPSVSRCLITRNAIGGGGSAGVICQGDRNSILSNDYSRSGYPGFPSGAGCVLLDTGTTGNFVRETRFPEGTGVCDQVLDLGANNVAGAGNCR